MIISASIMCADLMNLEKECLKLELAGVDRIHIDIMDGRFVNNIELGFSIIKAIRRVTALPFEIHLMTIEPDKYLDKLLDCDGEFICFHIETTENIDDLVQRIRQKNKKAGIVINPQTPAEYLLPYLQSVDMITFMTVEPGFAGQPFKPDVIHKIRLIKKAITEKDYDVELETDGHMDELTVPEVCKSGANAIVAGSSSLFIKGTDYREAVKKIRSWVKDIMIDTKGD